MWLRLIAEQKVSLTHQNPIGFGFKANVEFEKEETVLEGE